MATPLLDLAGLPPWSRLAPEHLALLAETGSGQRFRAGELILASGAQPAFFYIVLSGAIDASPLPDVPGEADCSWDLLAGDCFPVGAWISGSTVSSTYTAAEDSEAWAVPPAVFADLLRDSEPFQQICLTRAAALLARFRHLLVAQRDAVRAVAPVLGQPLRAVLRRTPVTCAPDRPLADVLRLMHEERIGAMIVVDPTARPLGILTLHDVLDRVALTDADRNAPVSRYMTPRPLTLATSASAQTAAMAMVRHGIRHVVVTDEERVVGIVSENDLFSLQRLGLRELSGTIARSTAADDVVRHGADIRRLAATMLEQGIVAEQLTGFLASLNDALAQRLLDLLFAPHVTVRYCWIALGSEGRQEQTLVTDQDNGLIFVPAAGADVEATRRTLLGHARTVNEALDRAGYALCKGGIMAGNPACCLTLAEWQARFGAWLDSGTPEALLDAAIFFDFRALHGDAPLADELRTWLHARIARVPKFLHQLAANAQRARPPVGVIRDFVTDGRGSRRNTIDLKMNGATPFVDAARLYGLQTGVMETNTVARLRTASRRLGIAETECEGWTRAFLFIQLMRLRAQHAAMDAGREPDNRLDPYALNDMDRLTLREALRQARRLQRRLALDFQL